MHTLNSDEARHGATRDGFMLMRHAGSSGPGEGEDAVTCTAGGFCPVECSTRGGARNRRAMPGKVRRRTASTSARV